MINILFVSPEDLSDFTIPNGGTYGSKSHLNILSLLPGVKVTVLSLSRVRAGVYNEINYIPATKNKLETLFMNCAGYSSYLTFKSEKIIFDYLRNNNYDILFLDSSNFGRIAKKSRKKFKSIKVVTFFHNVEYLYALSVMKASGFFYLPSFMASWHNETLAVKFSNVIIAINERDRAVIEQKYHTAVSGLLPPCFPDYVIPENDKSALISKPLNVLFLGSWFHANIAGIKWFITKVLPFADIRLVIAGRGMEKIKEIFPLSNKLYVIGTMQNTEEIYRKADCVVNPVFIGSGMKIKTGEALRYGRTVVGTREAFTGYNITNGKEGFICETADDFILAFDKIMKNQKMRANIASYNYFREYLTVDAAKKNMTALICDKQ